MKKVENVQAQEKSEIIDRILLESVNGGKADWPCQYIPPIELPELPEKPKTDKG